MEGVPVQGTAACLPQASPESLLFWGSEEITEQWKILYSLVMGSWTSGYVIYDVLEHVGARAFARNLIWLTWQGLYSGMGSAKWHYPAISDAVGTATPVAMPSPRAEK